MKSFKVKRIISIILSAVLVFALVGCGNSNDSKEINLMTWGGILFP